MKLNILLFVASLLTLHTVTALPAGRDGVTVPKQGNTVPKQGNTIPKNPPPKNNGRGFDVDWIGASSLVQRDTPRNNDKPRTKPETPRIPPHNSKNQRDLIGDFEAAIELEKRDPQRGSGTLPKEKPTTPRVPRGFAGDLEHKDLVMTELFV